MRKRLKSKRGFLLAEQTVKIIIALIGILILVFLLVSLYYSKIKADKQAKAFNTLTGNERIEDNLKQVEEGKVNPARLQIFEPAGWYIFLFTGEGIKPNSCVGENCICICADVWAFNIIDPFSNERERQTEECDEDGACLIINNLENREDQIEIIRDMYLLIKKENNKIKVLKE